MQITQKFLPKNRSDWRLWLMDNGASEHEIWLVYYKKHTGLTPLPISKSHIK